MKIIWFAREKNDAKEGHPIEDTSHEVQTLNIHEDDLDDDSAKGILRVAANRVFGPEGVEWRMIRELGSRLNEADEGTARPAACAAIRIDSEGRIRSGNYLAIRHWG